jgi:hypothetical protein
VSWLHRAVECVVAATIRATGTITAITYVSTYNGDGGGGGYTGGSGGSDGLGGDEQTTQWAVAALSCLSTDAATHASIGDTHTAEVDVGVPTNATNGDGGGGGGGVKMMGTSVHVRCSGTEALMRALVRFPNNLALQEQAAHCITHVLTTLPLSQPRAGDNNDDDDDDDDVESDVDTDSDDDAAPSAASTAAALSASPRFDRRTLMRVARRCLRSTSVDAPVHQVGSITCSRFRQSLLASSLLSNTHSLFIHTFLTLH